MTLTILVILSLTGALLLAWMGFVERNNFQVSRHNRTLRKPLNSTLKILHLSDTHFAGPQKARDDFFDRLAEEGYDLVLISGDIIDCREGIDSACENIAKLKAECGTFAVLGNHDYYDYRLADCFTHNFPGQVYPRQENPADELVAALEKAGIRVLKNETITFDCKGAALLLHGLDDATTGKANVRKALNNFDEDKINILLTHTIDVFLDIGENEIDLSFSGHSHGGQIRVPGYGAIITHTIMGRAFASGVFEHKGAVCSVSRGIGTGRYLPFRLFCPPEAIVLEARG